MLWFDVVKWVSLAVGLVGGLFLGYKELKERKARANGLAPNPTRCEDHEGRLRKVEAACLYMSPQIASIESDISEVKTDVKELIKLHLKRG